MAGAVKIRLLCITHVAQEMDKLNGAFDMVRQDYEVGSGGLISLEEKWDSWFLSNIPFENYYGGNWGISKSWITDKCSQIFKEYGDSIDCVMFFIPGEYWTKEGDRDIWGWNLGRFFSGYQVQLIRISDTVRSLQLTISMELMHQWNEQAYKIGIDLNKIFGVAPEGGGYDELIVHSRERWLAGYRNEIYKITDILIKIFQPKEIKFAIIDILKKLIELYRLKIISTKSSPSPVIFDHIGNGILHIKQSNP